MLKLNDCKICGILDDDQYRVIQSTHWDVPRYKNPVTIGEVAFQDPAYHLVNLDEFLPDSRKEITDDIRQEIISVIQSHL